MMKRLFKASVGILALALLIPAGARPVSPIDFPAPVVAKDRGDCDPVPSFAPRKAALTALYTGPGGYDYRTGRLAQYIQSWKAARRGDFASAALLAPGPLPPPPGPVGVRVPVILVEYQDIPLTVTTPEIDDLLFGSASSPNMTDYYDEVSYGNIFLTGDVYGPYRVSGNFADYPASAIFDFITEAITLADPDIDFSRYDSDGDGYLDGLIVVASEYIQVLGYESAHAWAVPDHVTGEGIIATSYTSQREDCSLGIFCHEFGHTLGLPDLYSGGSGQTLSIRDWGLMGNGASLDPPAHLCAWSKIELGWIEPVEITSSVDDQPIGNAEEYAEAYRLSLEGMSAEQYLLVENRRRIGSDAALPGEGLLIWHVGYDSGYGMGNHVVLVPAGTGRPDNAANNDTDPFPGSGGVREYRDELFGIVISDISDSASVMTADFTIPESVNGWRVLESGVESDLCAVRFTDENTGWAAGEDGIIIHTSDGGENWTVQAAAGGEDLAALCFVDSATGWAAGAAGTILATTDGGNTWIDRYTGTWEDLNSVSFVDRSAGWALSSEGTLLSTADGGATWSSSVLSTGGEAAVEVEFATANNGFIAGAETTLFCSGDGGGSWNAWTGVGSTSVKISGLCVRADNDLWLVGSSDRGYLYWVWEGHTTYLTAADYKKLIDVDFCSDLGVAVGDRLMVMNLDSSLGYGLNLFSLGFGSSDHIMDDMEWVEPQEWSDRLENATLAVDVVSGDVAYVVGGNGMILRYDRESSWTAGTAVPIDGGMYRPVEKFEAEYDIDGLRKWEYDPAVTMTDRFRFLLDNGPVVDWPLPARYGPAAPGPLSSARQLLRN